MSFTGMGDVGSSKTKGVVRDETFKIERGQDCIAPYQGEREG